MARRKSTRGSKIQPAAMTLAFTIPAVSGASYIDLSQVASLVNRRFYRQGINWAVAGFKVLTGSNLTGSFKISKLPNTWVMSNAWEKSFRAWQRMNNEALDETPSVRPKFLDFKIYANEQHHAQGFAANLLPISSNISPFIAGEWEPSKITQPRTDGTATVQERELIAVGANYPGAGASGFNAVSLIEGYAASRGLPDVLDPNAPVDSASVDGNIPANWMASMFNQGTEQTETVIEDMISENNIAPYPFENDGVHVDTMYPGGANQGNGLQIHDFEFVTGTTIGGTTRLKGGNFPCGLIELGYLLSGAEPEEEFNLLIDLVPGNHRGYLCEPMTEM